MNDLQRALDIAQQLVDEGRDADAIAVLRPALIELDALLAEFAAARRRPLGFSTTETASRRPPVVRRRDEGTP